MSTYSVSLQSKQALYNKLHSSSYRDAFVSSHIAQTIAGQIKVMRQGGDLSLKDLARELGTSQNAVYRLENPKYGTRRTKEELWWHGNTPKLQTPATTC